MSFGARVVLVPITLVALVAPLAGPATAGHASLTLEASAAEIRIGKSVVLSGHLAPAPEKGPAVEGQTVRIVDEGGIELDSALTAADGSYSLSLSPTSTVTVHAEWTDESLPEPETVSSEPLTVAVRAVLTASIRGVYLFGKAKVAGRLRPAHPGERVTVKLLRGRKVVRTKSVLVRDGGRFVSRIPVRRPGEYRARVFFADDDHLPARARTARRRTPLPRLGPGSRHVTVRFLEQRLRELRYRLTGINRNYDTRTGDTIMAFNKVQGRARVRTVDESTWRALVSPRRPRARSTARGFHIEIDLTRQVLYTVKNGTITNILHTSTGQYVGWTRPGVYHVWGKVYGYSVGRLYYPSYFDGLRAVHGWPDVPPYPASHGCARVPMWSATWISGLMPVGTEVRVYY